MPDQPQDETVRDERRASNHDLADQVAVAAAEALAPAVAVAAVRVATATLVRTAVGGTAIGAAGVAAATVLQTPAAKRAIVRIAKPLAREIVESARSGTLNRTAHQAAGNAKHAVAQARSAASDIQHALQAKSAELGGPVHLRRHTTEQGD